MINNKAAHKEFNEFHLCYLANLKQVYRHLKTQYNILDLDVNILAAISYYNDPYIESEYDEVIYPNGNMIVKYLGQSNSNTNTFNRIKSLCSLGYIKIVREYKTPQGFITKLYKLDVKGILVCRSFTTYMRNLVHNRYTQKNVRKMERAKLIK